MTAPEPSLTVSVAIGSHNGMPFVVDQVRTILHQSRQVNQIVLSDDDSTDDTVVTVRELAARCRAERNNAPALTVLQNRPALGVVRNFEQAISACTSELIVLCDQDDLWAPNRIERMAEEFEVRQELTLLHSDARLVDGDGTPIGMSLFGALELTERELQDEREGRAFDVLLRRNIVTGATVMFRRNLFEKAAPFPPLWVHDEWLAIHAAVLGRVDYLPEMLVDYRQHDANQIGARKPSLRDKIRKLREPRVERNVNRFERMVLLADRFQNLRSDLPDSVLEAVQSKADFAERTLVLPRCRLLRVAPVLRAALGGDYARFTRGRSDMLRDLLQPAQARPKLTNDPR